MKVQIVCVSADKAIFLPYVHGSIRAYIDDHEKDLVRFLQWQDPLFLDQPAADIADSIDADVVGMSCYVWNFNRQMKVARLVKEKNPTALIVAGGPHIPNNPSGFFEEHPYVDVLVHGEGEIPFANILKEHLYNLPIEEAVIPGTSTRKYDQSALRPTLPKDIGLRPVYASGYMDSSIDTVQKLGIDYWALWETNRGCPYQCSFCDWGSNLMNKIRKFSMVNLSQDIDHFSERKVENIYVCDANFGMLPVDEDITDHLVATKEKTGYPRQMRTSFAKKSNDRVFRITKKLMEANMDRGTTLSMQSMNENVLVAIDRKNIGVEKYKELQDRYRAEGYHTYSELILGLPGETKDTFIQGVCDLIEAGNEDIRVWELAILPNAPIAGDMEKYGLKTELKTVYLQLPTTPKDEVELKPVVFETATMSHDDWIDSYLFAWMVQTLHCGHYTKYIAEYLHREHDLSYRWMYEWIMGSMNIPDCVLGRSLHKLRSVISVYPEKPTNYLLQRVPGYGRTRHSPDHWMWLRLSKHKEIFYSRTLSRLVAHINDPDVVLNDLINFQKELMLDPSYDPTEGKVIRSRFNWLEYFRDKEPLVACDREYVIKQTHTGFDDQYPLVKDDMSSFADAAVGTGFLINRHRHYAHPLSEVQVR